MNLGSLFEQKKSEENPDWGHARNARALLRRSNAEFMQSAFCVEPDGFSTPNRDYPLEGLTAVVGGENWKFLDALPFRMESQGKPLRLRPAGVKIFPWKAEYSFHIEGVAPHASLEAGYYLLRSSKFPTLNVLFKLLGARKTTLFLKPFFDIRYMYAASAPQSHSHSFFESELRVRALGKEAVVASPSFTGFVPSNSNLQGWHYNLGSGFRENRGGAIRFLGESRTLYSPGVLCAQLSGEVEVQVSCGEEAHKPSIELRDHDEKRERSRATRLLAPFGPGLAAALVRWGPGAQKALAGRTIVLLDKFGFSTPALESPDAGSMWFRGIWFRDAFEGVRNNLPLYFASRKRDLHGLISGALSLAADGSVPNRLPEKAGAPADYSSTDSTLLCYLSALDYLALTRDPALSAQLQSSAAAFIAAAKKSGSISDEGLLYTPARHSWIDSVSTFAVNGGTASAPARIPSEWLGSFSSQPAQAATQAAHSAKYALIEINALWILALRGLSLRGSKEASEISARAEKAFRGKFFENGRLAGIVDASGRRNFSEVTPCIEALALLPDLFSDAEAKSIIASYSDCLVGRGGRLFGAIVRRSGERAYYGDAQYHGAVVWPRDSLYLFRVLHRLADPRAEEILLSQLEHQMGEGAVFYSHELFSLPEGANPSPTHESSFPVPVKNPAQYFSAW
ncbi:MAG: amylo-alpha-1,6-glucosidase, partial [Candidatus Micrarchaeota archaeon]